MAQSGRRARCRGGPVSARGRRLEAWRSRRVQPAGSSTRRLAAEQEEAGGLPGKVLPDRHADPAPRLQATTRRAATTGSRTRSAVWHRRPSHRTEQKMGLTMLTIESPAESEKATLAPGRRQGRPLGTQEVIRVLQEERDRGTDERDDPPAARRALLVLLGHHRRRPWRSSSPHTRPTGSAPAPSNDSRARRRSAPRRSPWRPRHRPGRPWPAGHEARSRRPVEHRMQPAVGLRRRA